MRVFIDESGFTGADYCNADQPLFVLACNWFEDEQATQIEQRIIERLKCGEIKFSKMVRKIKGQAELLHVIEVFNCTESKSRYATYVVHKKSALVRKFVLDCIEPSVRQDGIDMLKDGRIITYANLISTVMPTFMGGPWYETFLALYNRLIRTKDLADNQALYRHCLETRSNRDASDILSPYLANPDLVMEEIGHDLYRSDIFEFVVLGLIVHIRNMFGVTDFEVVLDSTKATTRDQLAGILKHLESLTASHKMSEVCTIHPDIQINNVEMGNSRDVIGIRMSDLVAGLFSWTFKSANNLNSLLGEALQMNIADENMIHLINSNDVTAKSLGMDGSQNPWE